jgi:Phosphotransferase enzyme family
MDEADRQRYGELEWAQPEWLATAAEWIEEKVGATANTREIDQIHLRPWSTVLRVPTTEGDLYFKALWSDSTFEPQLTALLAEQWPEHTAEPLAIDQDRAWMLTRHAGSRLREQIDSAADLHHWETLLPAYAEMQIELAPRAGELLDLGVPDLRLGSIPTLLGDLLDDPEALMLDRPDGLTSEERRRLGELGSEIKAMCAQVSDFGIPETLQHDDFHDGNVFVRGGDYVFFDWGDACVSHPFHTLVVTLRATAARLDLDPGGSELTRLRDAYLEPFSRQAGREELLEIFEIAYATGTIGRSLAHYRAFESCDPRFRSEIVDAVPYGLRRFLERGPIGSWRWD